MYFSYFVLFSRFFYKSYINKDYRAKEHSSNYDLNKTAAANNNVKSSKFRGPEMVAGNNYKAKVH